MDEGSRIGVVVRVRPPLVSESAQGLDSSRVAVDLSSASIVVALPDQKQKRFRFDKVFDGNVSQSELFTACQIDMMIRQVLQGYNATIMAYGQTGSGKTYTMDGYEYSKNAKPKTPPESRLGLIPRAVTHLFEEIRTSPAHLEHSVYCSFVQIYKEKVFDLLNPAMSKGQSQGLKLRWNKHEEFFVDNLSMHPCSNVAEVMAFFQSGLRNKVMGSHNLNATSSRSHCLLSLTIEAVDIEEGGMFTSKLQLVDLAGSERVSQTGNEGEAMKESIEINKSLFTLRQVISTLSNEGSKTFIPYRDSKLTSLLKQSIGGNSFCLMIACLAPIDTYLEENISTLTYATQTACIANEPVRNIDPKSKLVGSLKNEVQQLKSELAEAYSQIDMLTELLSLDRNQQAERISHYEKMNVPPAYMEKLNILKQSLGKTEPVARTETKTRPRKTVKETDTYLNPELLSEKLHDSVNMIRDLMSSNRKLKETVNELTHMRRTYEAELSQLQLENQDLQEKVEIMGNQNVPAGEILQLQHEKEELAKRLELMENENKQIHTVLTQPTQPKVKQEWGWKSKRTVVRARNFYIESPSIGSLGIFGERPDSKLNRRNKPRKSDEESKDES